jgi:hypothetical protein
MSSPTYYVYNSANATIAAPVKQPTGSTIRTMMQLKLATGTDGRIIAWGCSFDAAAAITPGIVELIETDVGATMSTAYAAADIQTYSNSLASANTAGASGTPFNLATTASGFATAAVTEGVTTVSRMADVQQIDPAFSPYVNVWPLTREFDLIPQRFLRVRATFSTTTNMICWILIEL